MASKYVDTPAIVQVLGCIYQNPKLIDQTDKYNFIEEILIKSLIALKKI